MQYSPKMTYMLPHQVQAPNFGHSIQLDRRFKIRKNLPKYVGQCAGQTPLPPHKNPQKVPQITPSVHDLNFGIK